MLHEKMYSQLYWDYSLNNYYYSLNVYPNLIGFDLFFVFFSQPVLKLDCSRSLPFWWDDVADFDTLEAIAVQTFNQVEKKHRSASSI